MDLDRAFRFSSILLAASGFIALILTGELPVSLVLLGLVALTISLLQLSDWGAGWSVIHWSRETWNILLVLAFVGFTVDFLWLSQDLLPAGVHFLILLMVNKLFNLHQRRDFLHLYAISLLELLAAAALTVEIWYAGAFIAYLLAAIWTLLLYHLRNEAEEAALRLSTGSDEGSQQRNSSSEPTNPGVAGLSPMPGVINARFFWTTNGIAMIAFGLTLAIFFAIPRMGAGFFQKNRMDLIRTSGFSEKVDLSLIGAIKLDQTVVMRVEFPDGTKPAAELLYMRGAAYDFYDGRTWSNTLSQRRVLPRDAEGIFYAAERPRRSQPTLRQDILLEPLDTPALFGLSTIESIKTGFMGIQADAMGNLYLPYSAWNRLQYSVQSTLHPIRDQERATRAFAYPSEILTRFLQLPALSPRVRELAEQVTATVGTAFDRVVMTERHLRENYRYSLDLDPPGQRSIPPMPVTNSFVYFLFSSNY
jgi:hypothetical protein